MKFVPFSRSGSEGGSKPGMVPIKGPSSGCKTASVALASLSCTCKSQLHLPEHDRLPCMSTTVRYEEGVSCWFRPPQGTDFFPSYDIDFLRRQKIEIRLERKKPFFLLTQHFPERFFSIPRKMADFWIGHFGH